MSLQRLTRTPHAPSPPPPESRLAQAGPVVLFIAATLIAGMTCILYLWQQSQILATSQDLAGLNRTLVVLQQQRDDLLAQVQSLQSVTHVIAQADKYGMTQGDPRQFKRLTVSSSPRVPIVAQANPDRQTTVLLPATNAAITSWWQGAWDGLYSLLQ
jgi:cell division protein FtsL